MPARSNQVSCDSTNGAGLLRAASGASAANEDGGECKDRPAGHVRIILVYKAQIASSARRDDVDAGARQMPPRRVHATESRRVRDMTAGPAAGEGLDDRD